jgi:hypothetical protein
LIFKTAIVALVCTVFYGLIFGGVHLVLGGDVWYRISDTVGITLLVLAVISIFFNHDSRDALWDALVSDYPGITDVDSDAPKSLGPVISTHLDDETLAVSFATRSAFSLKPAGPETVKKRLVSIPWSKISKVEIVEPDAEVLGKGLSEELVQLLGENLTVKVSLRRDRTAMTLAAPWNERFNELVPETVEIVKNWNWPFAR